MVAIYDLAVQTNLAQVDRIIQDVFQHIAGEDLSSRRGAGVRRVAATEGATNNQMELEAPAVTLDMLMRGRTPVTPAQFMKVVIRTDSSYVHDNVNAALYAWPKMGWKTKDGTVVLNQPDWERLVGQIERLAQRHRLRVFFEGRKARWADTRGPWTSSRSSRRTAHRSVARGRSPCDGRKPAKKSPSTAYAWKEPEGHPLAQSRQTVYEPYKACTQVAVK